MEGPSIIHRITISMSVFRSLIKLVLDPAHLVQVRDRFDTNDLCHIFIWVQVQVSFRDSALPMDQTFKRVLMKLLFFF